jgi:hypothetical protein
VSQAAHGVQTVVSACLAGCKHPVLHFIYVECQFLCCKVSQKEGFSLLLLGPALGVLFPSLSLCLTTCITVFCLFYRSTVQYYWITNGLWVLFTGTLPFHSKPRAFLCSQILEVLFHIHGDTGGWLKSSFVFEKLHLFFIDA